MTEVARPISEDWVIGQGRREAQSEAGAVARLHSGPPLVFVPDRMLCFTKGSRGEMNWTQDAVYLAGRQIRLHDDGVAFFP